MNASMKIEGKLCQRLSAVGLIVLLLPLSSTIDSRVVYADNGGQGPYYCVQGDMQSGSIGEYATPVPGLACYGTADEASSSIGGPPSSASEGGAIDVPPGATYDVQNCSLLVPATSGIPGHWYHIRCANGRELWYHKAVGTTGPIPPTVFAAKSHHRQRGYGVKVRRWHVGARASLCNLFAKTGVVLSPPIIHC